MKTKRLRIIIPLLILLLAGIGFVMHTGFGTISAIGWSTVSVLCPLGALNTMLASKTVVPRAVISLVIAVVGILLLGRAFCGWICPVPVFSKLRGITKPRNKVGDEADEAAPAAKATGAQDGEPAALTPEEEQLLHRACSHKACPPDMRPADSRHIVLGGALLSAAIFGFPVFCLVCPIGLSFALVFVLIQLFGAGSVTWSVIIIPALLAVEVVFFRKWCSHICPVSSLMSLVSKANRTWRPSIDNKKCLETTRGATCGRCGEVCEQGIDPRHPERGADWSECTRCAECISHCPSGAISLPFLPKKSEVANDQEEVKEA